MCITDGLSRMPTQYQTWPKVEDDLGLLVAAVVVEPPPKGPPLNVTLNNDWVVKYWWLVYYQGIMEALMDGD